MSETTGDQVVGTPATTAPAQTTTVEATTAVGQVPAAVEGSGVAPIVVGNQAFPSQAELVKAYQESMRGHTQATQRYSKELDAYKSVSDWLSTLKRDPSQWERFTKYVYGKADGSQPQVGLPAAPAQADVAQGDPRFDEFRSDLEGRLEAQQTQVEYLTFRHQHPDVGDDLMGRITDQVLKWDDEGKVRSFEEARRWILAEENAAKFVSAGQKQAEAAQTASRAAGGVLGTAPATAGAVAKPEAKFKDQKTVNQQNSYIRNLLGQFKTKK